MNGADKRLERISRCEFLRTATASDIPLLTSEENSRLQSEDSGGCVRGLFSRVG
jgi:hypothetical protein